MRAPTERQMRVLTTIKSETVRRGYPPTLREIGAILGIASTNGVNFHLERLIAKGLISQAAMKSRGVRLTPAGEDLLSPSKTATGSTLTPSGGTRPAPPDELVEVPVFASVHPDAMNLDRTLRLSASLVKRAHTPYGFIVEGEAPVLLASGLRPGDVLLFDPNIDIAGKIVLAYLDDEVSLRHYAWERIEQVYSFEAITSKRPTLYVKPEHLSPTMILGTAIGLWRSS